LRGSGPGCVSLREIDFSLRRRWDDLRRTPGLTAPLRLISPSAISGQRLGGSRIASRQPFCIEFDRVLLRASIVARATAFTGLARLSAFFRLARLLGLPRFARLTGLTRFTATAVARAAAIVSTPTTTL
jgi:hypothetical protein